MTDADLEEIARKAREVKMTDEQREAQRRSFVYGTTNIENSFVTPQLVNQVAEELHAHGRPK